MDPKRIVALVVGASVMVLIFSALLVPIINDATTTEKTFINSGAFYVEADPSNEYTLQYDRGSEPGVLYVNDVPIALPSSSYSVLVLDKSILRMEGFNNTMEYRGNGSTIAGIGVLDITVSAGSVTGTYQRFDGPTEFTWPTTTYTDAYVISDSTQDLIMSDYAIPVKMNEDSPIFGFGLTRDGAGGTALFLSKIEGNIEDGVTVGILDVNTGEALSGATVSNLSINATKLNEYVDLYQLTSITYTVTLANESTYNVTYSAYIVPAEVTSELAVHPDAATLSMLSVIPIIVMIGIVLAVVGVAIVGRNDY